MRCLLDSVIVIDHLNGIPAATEYLRSQAGHCAISVITRAEVLTGVDEPQLPLITQFLQQFPTLTMTAPIADLAATLRRQHRWRLPDAIQAAMAQFHQLQLVTRNIRDFPPEQYAFVDVPYRLD
ncbi:MAG: PIN domain-containing protein [Leptolyngbyaceae cyanobacterium]